MEGRFEDYTLGRTIEMGRVKEIFRLFKKHGFQVAGLRSFGVYLTDEDLAERRALADALRRDAERFAELQARSSEALAAIPASSKGVSSGLSLKTALWAVAVAGTTGFAVWRASRKKRG